jgi:hypothetical protein
MAQPTKDDLRATIREQRETTEQLRVKLLVEMTVHSVTKRKLEIATRKVGELVIEEEFKKDLASIESEPESEPEEV